MEKYQRKGEGYESQNRTIFVVEHVISVFKQLYMETVCQIILQYDYKIFVSMNKLMAIKLRKSCWNVRVQTCLQKLLNMSMITYESI